MSEFKGVYFGNLPPGCFENDPSAPWNDDSWSKETMLDEIYSLLRGAGYEPEYKGMRVKCQGWLIDAVEE